MCDPVTAAVVMAGASYASDAQTNRMIRAQNAAQDQRFAAGTQQAREQFQSLAGQRSNQLMQISEASGQKRVELEQQARQAASMVTTRRDSVVGASVDAELQAVHAARGRADAAEKRNLLMQELNYYQGTALDSAETAATILGMWKPDMPTISGGQMLINAAVQGVSAYAMAGGFQAGAGAAGAGGSGATAGVT